MAVHAIARTREALVNLGVCLLLTSPGCSSSDCRGNSDLQRVEEIDGAVRRIGTVKNGKKHGQWVSYYEGVLWEVEHYVNGKLHGPYRSLHENGKVFTATASGHGASGTWTAAD